LSLAIGLLACPFLGCSGAKPEQEKTPPAPVKWETARLLVLEEWTELVGVTQPLPQRCALITAPVEGRIVSLLGGTDNPTILEGQPISKGQEVAHLDDSLLKSNLAKANASVTEAEAQISSAKSAVHVAQLKVDRLDELDRGGSRAGGGSDAEVSRMVRKTDLPDARSALAGAKAQHDVAVARLKQIQEDVKALEVQLALYSLHAPIFGDLGRLRVALGQTVHTGDQITDVVDLHGQIDVLAYVPTATARQLRLGQSARLGGLGTQGAAAAVAGDPEGKVEYIAAQAEPETGNVAVKIRFPNKEAQLHANSTVRVRILTKPGKECLAIPESALMEDQEPPTVVVVEDVKTEPNKEKEGKEDQLGKARRIQTIIGIRDRVLHQVEILRLEDKEKKWKGDVEHALFVVEKGQGLQTGDAVKFEEEEEE
jgi:multidrug efflux pump subunit AcrA (membrane-fusion protein)